MDKVGQFYLPTKSAHKNLLCVMQQEIWANAHEMRESL